MKAIDLTGQKFGKLTVLERFYDIEHKYINKNARWICQCECGNKKVIVGADLRNGKTTSCGCFFKQQLSERLSLNLIGQHFGKLTVIKQLPSKNKRTMWLCQCECGNTTIARSLDLQNGDKISCGCVNSYGEALIQKYLTELNYEYKSQYTFKDLKSSNNAYLRFDFAIFVNQQLYCLLEFDGEQHFHPTGGLYDKENYEKLKLRDLLKNKYCQEHDIPLIRLNYLMLKNNVITKEYLQEKLQEIKNVK